MTRPILVFGAAGRVGGELFRAFVQGHSRYPLYGPSLSQCDITNAEQVAAMVAQENPVAIINLAACTLPYAEKPEARDEALRVNLVGLSNLGAEGLPLLHISTDCVFDGEKAEPYDPGDMPSPLNWYGSTKRFGEQELSMRPMIYESMGEDVPAHIILRTTGVYLADKPNFLKLVLDKARAGESMDVIADTLYSPTDARELARAILTATERVIEDPSVSGTYHFAGPDHMSYLDFAKLALEEAGLSMEMRPVTLAERELVDGFKRPRNASLNSDKFAETFGLRHRPTRECVRELVQPR